VPEVRIRMPTACCSCPGCDGWASCKVWRRTASRSRAHPAASDRQSSCSSGIDGNAAIRSPTARAARGSPRRPRRRGGPAESRSKLPGRPPRAKLPATATRVLNANSTAKSAAKRDSRAALPARTPPGGRRRGGSAKAVRERGNGGLHGKRSCGDENAAILARAAGSVPRGERDRDRRHAGRANRRGDIARVRLGDRTAIDPLCSRQHPARVRNRSGSASPTRRHRIRTPSAARQSDPVAETRRPARTDQRGAQGRMVQRSERAPRSMDRPPWSSVEQPCQRTLGINIGLCLSCSIARLYRAGSLPPAPRPPSSTTVGSFYSFYLNELRDKF